MIADVVLDQDKFPGVGNIIKIEGLHRAGVHPRRIVSTLSLDELCRLIPGVVAIGTSTQQISLQSNNVPDLRR
jgi:formamidopyrimidine-DNA glycosylase